MLDVLFLLAISRRFLQGLDDEGRCRWHDADRGLTVLDGQLHGHAKTLPITGSLSNVFSDLLW